MRHYLKDLNNYAIQMYCIDCRTEGKDWEDCIATLMFDNTTRCMEHTDKFITRLKELTK